MVHCPAFLLRDEETTVWSVRPKRQTKPAVWKEGRAEQKVVHSCVGMYGICILLLYGIIYGIYGICGYIYNTINTN